MGKTGESDPISVFRRIVPLPQAGPNSMRAEVLITAFATVAVTVGGGRRHVVVGEVGDDDPIWDAIERRSDWARSVAFRLE